jgi:hypothetical protein
MDVSLLWANWVIAVASILTAIGAIVSAYYARRAVAEQQVNFDRQIADYKLTLHAETLLKFESEFNSADFKRSRCVAAKALLYKRNEEEAEDIFDFFETVGLFVKVGALTPKIVYSVFFHWINLYYKAGKHHIGSRRQDTDALWGDFQGIYNAVCEIEKQTDPDSEDLKMPESRLHKQLQEEIDLCPELVQR